MAIHAPKKILIVEDEADIAQLVKGLLPSPSICDS